MNAGFTLAFWFNAASLGDSDDPAFLFDKANKANIGYAITADPNGIDFRIREWGGLYKNKKLTWNNQMSTGTWYHVAMVINRGDDTIKAWVDGQRVTGKIPLTQGSFICAGRSDLTMGGSKKVTFDEVHIFTKPLTKAEILDLYEPVIVPGNLVYPKGVDFADFAHFAAHWRRGNCDSTDNCNGTDFDGSSDVDARDLAILLESWLIGK